MSILKRLNQILPEDGGKLVLFRIRAMLLFAVSTECDFVSTVHPIVLYRWKRVYDPVSTKKRKHILMILLSFSIDITIGFMKLLANALPALNSYGYLYTYYT